MTVTDFLVARDDLRTTRCQTRDALEPAEGEVLLEVERFGLSANNITYATLGDAMRYWQFFPAPDGWGRVPVWGYAHVAVSRHPLIEAGRRCFGYLPTSTHLLVTPGEVTRSGFVDAAPHRSDLPGVYQRYQQVDPASGHWTDEDQQALWRPLLMTSFGAADFLIDRELYGARTLVVSSASSKTAMGLAALVRPRLTDQTVVGLTSAANVGFCERIGYYDRVLAYEEIPSLGRAPQILIDFTGNEQVLSGVRDAAGDNHRRTVVVGVTHWEHSERAPNTPNVDSELFFLPPWIEKRRADWGPNGFFERYAEAWAEFRPTVEDWMRVVHHDGLAALETVYRELVDGHFDPAVGHIVTFADLR